MPNTFKITMEIERKFLILQKFVSELYMRDAEKIYIEQFYVTVGNVEERFRRWNEKYFHSIKAATEDLVVRKEVETPCAKEIFKKNKSLRIGETIFKERHIFYFSNNKIEIDFYREKFEGLVVGEVEFESKKQADNFEVPYFFGKEITQDKRYSNQNLALNGIPK